MFAFRPRLKTGTWKRKLFLVMGEEREGERERERERGKRERERESTVYPIQEMSWKEQFKLSVPEEGRLDGA